jgi:hypothetical protein
MHSEDAAYMFDVQHICRERFGLTSSTHRHENGNIDRNSINMACNATILKASYHQALGQCPDSPSSVMCVRAADADRCVA